MRASPHDVRPLSSTGAWARTGPFLGAFALSLLTLLLPPGLHHPVRAAILVVVVAAFFGLVPVLPWRLLPAWAEAVPPFSLLVVVVLLRQWEGGSASGVAPLALMTIMWLALYGTRRQLFTGFAAVTALFVGPQLAVGPPAYPLTDLRRALIYLVVSVVVGGSARALVASLSEREHEARGTAERLDAVLEAAVDFSVIGTNLDGVIVLFNDGAERMLGYQAEEMVGRSPEILHLPEELAARAAELAVEPNSTFIYEAAAGQSERRRWTYRRRDGGTLLADLTVSATRSADGSVTGYLGIAEDVTARVAAEERLRSSEANLAAVARVVRQIQTGAGARDTVVEACREMTGAQLVILMEPDGLGNVVPTVAAGELGLPVLVLPLSTPKSRTVEVFHTGRPVFAVEAARHPSASQPLRELIDAASMLWHPVHQHGEVVAVLVVSWASRLTAPVPWEVDAVALLGDELSIALDQESLMRRLRDLAVVDPLTGVGNRRAWDEALDLELSRARRSHQTLTVAMFDLDNFKHFNDNHGHAAGDELLVAFAAAAAERIRDVDAFARWGGEEFALALPGCDAEMATIIVERVRSSVPDGQTCSAGCAVWDGLETSTALLTRVDDALYVAKTRGRDQTVVDGHPTAPTGRVVPTG